MDQITVIRRSLAIFALGILSLLPLIGLIPAIYALITSSQIRANYQEPWNPASRYLKAGSLMARLGFFGSAILIFLLVAALMLNLIG